MDTSINPQKYCSDYLWFYFSGLLNDDFDFDVSIANEVAIDIAMHTLLGIKGSAVITLPGS